MKDEDIIKAASLLRDIAYAERSIAEHKQFIRDSQSSIERLATEIADARTAIAMLRGGAS